MKAIDSNLGSGQDDGSPRSADDPGAASRSTGKAAAQVGQPDGTTAIVTRPASRPDPSRTSLLNGGEVLP
jgi:hypothetical protein